MNVAFPHQIVAELRRAGVWTTGLLCALAVIPTVAGNARADDPIVQTSYTADSAPLVFNGRVYLSTAHDEDASTSFTMKEWRVYSSADKVNWTDHGSPMSLATFSWPTANAWAGQVIARNGRFYWYVPVTNRTTGTFTFFYHNGALPGGWGFTRSVAVEQFSYRADGTIPITNMTTTGAPQVGGLNPYVRQEAETIAWESGVETEPSSEGGMGVGFIENGDYVKVKGAAFGAGAASFSARVASPSAGGRIELRLGGLNGALLGTCTVSGTGGWQTWTTVSCPVTGATGTRDLYLRFAGGSGFLLNANWWQFSPPASGGDLLTNGTMENGTPGRGTMGSGSLSSSTSPTRGGSRVLAASERTASWNGPAQFVASQLTDGRSYATTMWVRPQSGTPDAKVALTLTANGSHEFHPADSGGRVVGRDVDRRRPLPRGPCLDARGAGTTDSTPVILWTCTNGNNH